jgi:hypothetical protein
LDDFDPAPFRDAGCATGVPRGSEVVRPFDRERDAQADHRFAVDAKRDAAH